MSISSSPSVHVRHLQDIRKGRAISVVSFLLPACYTYTLTKNRLLILKGRFLHGRSVHDNFCRYPMI
jgi:hypothetical protein